MVTKWNGERGRFLSSNAEHLGLTGHRYIEFELNWQHLITLELLALSVGGLRLGNIPNVTVENSHEFAPIKQGPTQYIYIYVYIYIYIYMADQMNDKSGSDI